MLYPWATEQAQGEKSEQEIHREAYHRRASLSPSDDFYREGSSAQTAARAHFAASADASEIGPGWTDEHISQALEVSTTTIGRVRQQFGEQSLTAALERRSPSG